MLSDDHVMIQFDTRDTVSSVGGFKDALNNDAALILQHCINLLNTCYHSFSKLEIFDQSQPRSFDKHLYFFANFVMTSGTITAASSGPSGDLLKVIY